MTENSDPAMMNRRGFLKAMTVTAVGATAVGAGAALIKTKGTTTITSAPLPAIPATRIPTLPANPVVPSHGVDLSQLAASQAENIRLKAELDAATRRINTLEGAGSVNNDMSGALRTELDSANSQIGVLSGLVALYEQLDDVDVSAVVANGLDSVGGLMDELVDDIPTVSDALAAGRSTLDALENEIPTVESGRRWLKEHTATLARYYQVADIVLQSAVDTAGSFFVLLAQWFADVTKWLPFGMGDTATRVVTAVSDLVNLTPSTIDGLQSNVHDPLLRWLGDDDEEAPLLLNVVRPVRDNALVSAENTVLKAQNASTAYKNHLAIPVRNQIEQRRQMQLLIQQYRDQYQV